MDIALLDIVFGFILLLFTIRCAFKGFIAEFMMVASLLFGVVGGLLLYRTGAGLITQYIGESIWNPLIAFLAVFLIIYLIIKIIQRVLEQLFEQIQLETLDRALGVFLGLIEGLLVVILILAVMQFQTFIDFEAYIQKSIISRILLAFMPYMSGIISGRL